jgi:hypothetical protein
MKVLMCAQILGAPQLIGADEVEPTIQARGSRMTEYEVERIRNCPNREQRHE